MRLIPRFPNQLYTEPTISWTRLDLNRTIRVSRHVEEEEEEEEEQRIGASETGKSHETKTPGRMFVRMNKYIRLNLIAIYKAYDIHAIRLFNAYVYTV